MERLSLSPQHSRTLFFLLLLLSGSGAVSTPVALVLGVLFGVTQVHPYAEESHGLARLLLQVAVVALGFGMDVRQVLRAGSSGFLYTACSIAFALALGLLLGRALRVAVRPSFLLTAGTAICGGSAIAALAPITGATADEISVSMGTVFLLNSVALLLFPAVGHTLHLSQTQFGLWAALAVHDTSSVVGASAKYGAEALRVGTTVKLARALWIVPVSFATAAVVSRSGGRAGKTQAVRLPWFILLFCAAAAANTYLPRAHETFAALSGLGRTGLAATLFLIGTGLSPATLRHLGLRPLAQAIILWLVVGTGSLLLIRYGRIAL